MSNSKPLGYDSLQSVIRYLEPTSRIALSIQLPTFRFTEKAVPLTIKNLRFTEFTTTVDSLICEIGVTRFDKHEDKWRLVRSSDHCKVFHDVDKYGLRIPLQEATPGDSKFEEEEFAEATEEEVKAFLDSNQTMVTRRESGFWEHIRQIDYCKRLADQFVYKKNKLDPLPFKYLIHLTVRMNKDDESDFHEFVEYTGNLSAAVKYVNTRVFGGRAIPIKLRNLNISTDGCIRLPEKWKVDVQHLTIKANTSCLEVVRPILAKLPLETITVHKLQAEDYPMLECAREVRVSQFSAIPRRLSFQRVHFERADIEADRLMGIIENWRENEQPIGTYYSFVMSTFGFPRFVDDLKSRPGVVVREDGEVKGSESHYLFPQYPHKVIVPVNYNSEVSIRLFEDFSILGLSRLDVKLQSTRMQTSDNKDLVIKDIPLSDNSQKVIISNMSPSFRLYLSRKNPAFASLEKASSLKIKNLSITSSYVIINRNYYHFGVQRYDKEGDLYRVASVKRTAHFNVDRYGFRLPSSILPGDLDFGLTENENEKKDLAALDEEHEQLELDFRRQEGNNPRQEFTRRRMEWNRLDAERYYHKRENKDPSYKFFLYLQMFSGKHRKTELMEYQQNQHIGMKYLIEKLLGGRAGMIHVKNLALEADNNILRIPESLKLAVKNLTVTGNRNGLKILEPLIINLNSLMSIGIDRVHKDDHMIFNTAERVVITKEPEERLRDQLNHRHVTYNYFDFDQMIEIIDGWQRNVPKVGTRCTFVCKGYRNKNIIENFARRVGVEIGEVSETRFGRSHLCVIFPINDQQECTIHIPKRNSPLFGLNGAHPQHHNFLLRHYTELFEMEVRPRKSATRIEEKTVLGGYDVISVCVLAMIVLYCL